MMENKIKEILLEGNRLFSKFGETDIFLLNMSIFHTKTIIMELKSRDLADKMILKCSYCKSYKGDMNVWHSSNLCLEYDKEILKYNQISLEEYVFVIRDRKKHFFIKCKYVFFNPILGEEELKSDEVLGKSNGDNLRKITQLLKKWEKGRVRLVNSDKSLLRLIVDVNTQKRFINFSKQDDSLWYSYSTSDFLEILCYEPIFLSATFDSWEIKESLILNSSNNIFTITDGNSDFKIKCSSITIKEATSGLPSL